MSKRFLQKQTIISRCALYQRAYTTALKFHCNAPASWNHHESNNRLVPSWRGTPPKRPSQGSSGHAMPSANELLLGYGSRYCRFRQENLALMGGGHFARLGRRDAPPLRTPMRNHSTENGTILLLSLDLPLRKNETGRFTGRAMPMHPMAELVDQRSPRRQDRPIPLALS